MVVVDQASTIIDADNLILGRMASIVAKKLLEGERIVILNAEKIVISGKRRSRVSEAKEFLRVGHPRKGPFHYRRPDRIARRTVRGMLPYKKAKGKQAYKSLKVFIGIPDEFKDQETETLLEAQAERLKCPYFKLGEFAEEVGWNPGE